jgi:hypothetical protein
MIIPQEAPRRPHDFAVRAVRLTRRLSAGVSRRQHSVLQCLTKPNVYGNDCSINMSELQGEHHYVSATQGATCARQQPQSLCARDWSGSILYQTLP